MAGQVKEIEAIAARIPGVASVEEEPATCEGGNDIAVEEVQPGAPQ